MREALLEWIPNLSEGRNQGALEQLWQALNQVPALQCLHRCSDYDHHRTVLTLAGPPQSIREAGHVLFEWAQHQIDLNQHQGVHPRVGAVDVFPLVPLAGMTTQEAVDFSRALAQEYAERWQLPIYLYEQSAQSAERAPLPAVRRGGLEGLKERIQSPEWAPDFGPQALHPQLGATVLGVRKILIAWNVLLKSQDLALAQRIARRIRTLNGGFPAVRALGLYLESRDCVQVSMNLLDDQITTPFEVMEKIRAYVHEAGVEVLESEFIGLPPTRIFLEAARRYFCVSDSFAPGQILEARLRDGVEIMKIYS